MGYKIQIGDDVRDATPEETAVIDAQRAEAEAQEALLKAKADVRQSALDKLAGLGLTEEEIQVLLGL